MRRLLLLLLCFLSPGLAADQVLVAVAANFAEPMNAIAARFEKDSGHEVQLAYGSSGKFYAQIMHGAPFDVFLSADTVKPEALASSGKVIKGSRFTYAEGRLVLWSREIGFIANQLQSASDRLSGDQYSRLALANPRLAPYGLAATQTLAALELRASTESRWVIGENISQTYQFVSTGNAQLGFVAASQAMQQGELVSGSGWLVPKTLHDPIHQDAVMLTRAAGNQAAIDLLAFMRSTTAAEIIKRYGYEVPD